MRGKAVGQADLLDGIICQRGARTGSNSQPNEGRSGGRHRISKASASSGVLSGARRARAKVKILSACLFFIKTKRQFRLQIPQSNFCPSLFMKMKIEETFNHGAGVARLFCPRAAVWPCLECRNKFQETSEMWLSNQRSKNRYSLSFLFFPLVLNDSTKIRNPSTTFTTWKLTSDVFRPTPQQQSVTFTRLSPEAARCQLHYFLTTVPKSLTIRIVTLMLRTLKTLKLFGDRLL